MPNERGGASRPGESTGSGSERDGAEKYPGKVTTGETDGGVGSANWRGSVAGDEKLRIPKIT